VSKRKNKKAIVVDLPRDQLMRVASKIANESAKKLPFGARIVVAVTDVSGEWVGVGSNTNPYDVESILRSALLGADRRDSKVLEAVGDEIE